MALREGESIRLMASNQLFSGIICSVDDIGFSFISAEKDRFCVSWDDIKSGAVKIESENHLEVSDLKHAA